MSTTFETEAGAQANGKVQRESAARPGPLDVLRGFGVMVTGPLLLCAGALGSVVSVVRSLARGRFPRLPAVLGVAALAAYVARCGPTASR